MFHVKHILIVDILNYCVGGGFTAAFLGFFLHFMAMQSQRGGFLGLKKAAPLF